MAGLSFESWVCIGIIVLACAGVCYCCIVLGARYDDEVRKIRERGE